MEDVSLETLYSEYIFDGCFSLLLHIFSNESSRSGQLMKDESSETHSILNFSVKLLESLSQVQPLHENVDTYIAMMLNIPGSNDYKDEIITMKRARPINGTESKKPSSSEQRSQERIPFRQMRDYNDKQNIQIIVDHIVGHLEADDIIDKMVKFLQGSDIKSQKEDAIFVLKILRRYIEIRFARNLDSNLHSMWEDISCAYPKEVETIQEKYRGLGLTKILYKLLLQDDFEMFKEAISLSIIYVYGGNNKIQNEFYESFTADEESEVLSNLNDRLSMYFNIFKIQEARRIHYLHTDCQADYTQPAEKKEENQMFLLILTFLQALCESQFIEMQVFLREHKLPDHSSQRSFNVLGFLRDSTAVYCKVLNKYNLVVGYKLLDLVTELVQGDVDENISIFLSQTLVYDLCKVLTDYNTNRFTVLGEVFNRDYQTFNSKIIMLFKIILESCDERNRNVLRKHLDVRGLIEIYKSSMIRFSRHFGDLTGGGSEKVDFISDSFFASGFDNSDLDDALNIYILLRCLWNDVSDEEFDEKLLEFLKDIGSSTQDESLEYNALILTRRFLYDLEIVIKKEKKTLIRVWFPLKPALQISSGQMTLGFFAAYCKYSAINNVSELLEHSQHLITLFKVNHQTKNLVGLLFKFYYFVTWIYNYPVILAMNIVNIATYKLENETIYQDSYNRKQVRNMNIAQIVLLCFSLISYWRGFKDSNVSTNWEKYVEKNTMKMKCLAAYIKCKLDSRRCSDLTKYECFAVIKLKGVDSEEFRLIREHALTFKGLKLWLMITNAWFSIKSWEIISQLSFIAIAIGSLFHPLVAMLQLYYIASGSETVEQITKAVFKNPGQLIWTLILLIFATAIYSTIGFFFLNDTFVNSNDNNRLCETAFACFINVLNFGIRSGGGIGDVIQPIPYEGHNTASFFWMAIFNLSFYVIVIILLLSIIFGMIIDTFGEIRDENIKMRNNRRNICSVCGLERAEIEKYADFEQHRAIEHSKWTYVFYVAYLLDKQKNDKNSMTEIENYVMNMYRTKNDDWIPVGRSLTLERAHKKEKVNKESEIDVLTKKIDSLMKNKAQNEMDE